MNELLANVTEFNSIYQSLFNTFLSALKKGLWNISEWSSLNANTTQIH